MANLFYAVYAVIVAALVVDLIRNSGWNLARRSAEGGQWGGVEGGIPGIPEDEPSPGRITFDRKTGEWSR